MRPFFLFFVAWAATAHAHDFWIEPSTFRPAPGQSLAVSLRVGQNFVGDPIPRSAQLIASFTVRESAGERPIAGLENRDPAGFLRLSGPGPAIIGYQGKPHPLELPAEKFNEFLHEEGLEHIRGLRREQRHRERFSRYAKAVVGGSGVGSRGSGEPLGHRLEIIPETALRVRVVLQGKPYANALVTALHRDDEAARLSLRTDAAGRVTLPLAKNGVWLVKCVAILPAAAASGVDWETLWASLTFER